MQEGNGDIGLFSSGTRLLTQPIKGKAGLYKKVLVMYKNSGMYPRDFRNNKARLRLASCGSRGVQICLPVPAEMNLELFRSTYPIKTNSHPISSTTLIPTPRLCGSGCRPDLVVTLHAKWCRMPRLCSLPHICATGVFSVPGSRA